jgi:hypothetical protein
VRNRRTPCAPERRADGGRNRLQPHLLQRNDRTAGIALADRTDDTEALDGHSSSENCSASEHQESGRGREAETHHLPSVAADTYGARQAGSEGGKGTSSTRLTHRSNARQRNGFARSKINP